jgi:hypothetical protein
LIREHDIDDRAVAERLVSYADAVAAVSFLGVSALGIAIADPETRVSIAVAANWIIVANVLIGALFTGAVLTFRRWESDLRSEGPPAEKAQRYSRYLHWGRLTLVWISFVQAVVLMLWSFAECPFGRGRRGRREPVLRHRRAPRDTGRALPGGARDVCGWEVASQLRNRRAFAAGC